jgi:hypothetical protein
LFDLGRRLHCRLDFQQLRLRRVDASAWSGEAADGFCAYHDHHSSDHHDHPRSHHHDCSGHDDNHPRSHHHYCRGHYDQHPRSHHHYCRGHYDQRPRSDDHQLSCHCRGHDDHHNDIRFYHDRSRCHLDNQFNADGGSDDDDQSRHHGWRHDHQR